MIGSKKLRPWFSLDEVAQYLTTLDGNNVSVADVIRFALDEHLKLSLRLITPAKARPGFRLPTEEESLAFMAEVAEVPHEVVGKELRGGECITLPAPVSGEVASAFALDEGEDDDCGQEIGLIVENYVVSLEGIVDLLLLSDGRQVVEDMYQALIGLPPAYRQFDKGVYFEGQGRAVYQLQEHFNEVVFKRRQLARTDNLRRYIEDNNFSAAHAKKYLAREDSYRQAHLRHQKQTLTMRKYMPAGSIPLDSALVIRAESLATFVAKLNSNLSAADVGVVSAAPGASTPSLLDAEQAPPRTIAGERGEEVEEPKPRTSENWKIRIQAEATRMILNGRKQGAQPKPYSIVEDLARWCVKNNVLTTTGIHPSAGYIRIHVLSGKHWTMPKWET
jgi:hypothetical protein